MKLLQIFTYYRWSIYELLHKDRKAKKRECTRIYADLNVHCKINHISLLKAKEEIHLKTWTIPC